MNKLLKFLMPKTARLLDEQQLQIIELEKEVSYFKTRISSKDDIREKNYVRNGLVSTSVTSNSSPVRSSNSIIDTNAPTVYSDSSSHSSYSSSSCDSSSSSDSGSCCCD
jgi:hypothetical protein